MLNLTKHNKKDKKIFCTSGGGQTTPLHTVHYCIMYYYIE